MPHQLVQRSTGCATHTFRSGGNSPKLGESSVSSCRTNWCNDRQVVPRALNPSLEPVVVRTHYLQCKQDRVYCLGAANITHCTRNSDVRYPNRYDINNLE